MASTTLRTLYLALAGLVAASGPGLHAQAPEARAVQGIFVNSEFERYLRVLQVSGAAEIYPWSIRGFSPRELDRIGSSADPHPWWARYRFGADDPVASSLAVIPPTTRILYNSAFPFGGNDGPLWAGRGLTSALEFGVAARYGPLSLVLAPIAFRAENDEFELMPNGRTGRMAFADGTRPTQIDLPQRFGDEAYARLDPGESTVRLDAVGLAAGVSTASQHWGPARDHPILLGNNAGGYLHGFVGTASPLDLWIAKFHGKLVWGRLEQSGFTNITGIGSRRFTSGLIVLFTPRGLDGVEIGIGRFYHIPWPDGGPRTEHLLRPLEAFLKERRGPLFGGADPWSTMENQLASVFLRWVHPASGFEVYGEYGRNDHNWDLRDFLLEPDHDAAYMMGFQKTWASGRRTSVLRGEVLNARISHLSRVRNQVPIYRHHATRQGHTQRGQVLGSAAAYGGDGAVVAADVYHPKGRWTVEWTRTLRQERGIAAGAQVLDPQARDVIHSLGVEALLFRNRFDITAGLRAAQNFNRNHQSDAFNLNATLGVRAAL
jgi:hypothetical protein